ncbi:reverse transcriptase domain-containing protein [Tanacetum coccineum]|uniref:Reverse transcriptase domain-containing protein n=1 Tax=Tanacetum coccineum TaxID=301880 RepID=A0ABQ5AFT0_9ASTR
MLTRTVDVERFSTRSGVANNGPPTIPPTPSPLPKEVERETDATKKNVKNTSLGSTAHVQPLVVQDPIPEPEVASKPNPKPSILYLSRLNDQKLRKKANNQILKFLQIFQRLHFDSSFADALLYMPMFASTFKSLLICQKVLGFWDNSSSGNPTPSDPTIASSSPSFTPFEGGDFILEEIETFYITPEAISNLDYDYYDTEGDILYLEKLLNEDPSPTLPPMKNDDLKQVDVTMTKPSNRRNEYYCFLDGFSGYFQIPIDPQDQEKTTFTCPYGTFAYRRMPFGLCNAPGTLQRCMMAIFHDMIEETMEVFMEDFPVFEDSFSSCLSHLDKMLKRCEDTNLVLNWEKCHFMVKEGIVLGHKISKSGIEVDRAKVDVIAKLPHPTSVKGDCPDYEDSRARGFVHRSLDLQSFACLYMGI